MGVMSQNVYPKNVPSRADDNSQHHKAETAKYKDGKSISWRNAFTPPCNALCGLTRVIP